MEVIDLNELAVFSKEFAPKILRARPDYKVPLICLEEGQAIPPHPSGTGVFYFISGTGTMTVDGETSPVGPGSMVFVEKGQSRGIKAAERLPAFAVHMG